MNLDNNNQGNVNGGLSIRQKDFNKLPQTQKMSLLYENTELLKCWVKGYKFNQKLQYAWLIVLTVLTGLGKFLGFI